MLSSMLDSRIARAGAIVAALTFAATAATARDSANREGNASTTAETRPATLLFKSGFEEGVTLDPKFEMYPNGGWQDIGGVDSVTGFAWPPRIGVPATMRFQMIIGRAVEPDVMKRDYVENRIATVIGPRGTPTRSLYQLIKSKGEGFCCTQDTFMLQPAGEPGDLYISFWIKLQPDLLEKNANSWKAFFEWKTRGDYRITTGITTRDGMATWRFQGDNIANGKLPKEIFWRIENGDLPVPVGEWFKYEVFWHRSAGSDGRAWTAVNGTVIGDYRGPLMGVRGDPIDRIMIPNLYQGGAAPHYQWVDDLEIWDGFPPAGDNPPYAPHVAGGTGR